MRLRNILFMFYITLLLLCTDEEVMDEEIEELRDTIFQLRQAVHSAASKQEVTTCCLHKILPRQQN